MFGKDFWDSLGQVSNNDENIDYGDSDESNMNGDTEKFNDPSDDIIDEDDAKDNPGFIELNDNEDNNSSNNNNVASNAENTNNEQKKFILSDLKIDEDKFIPVENKENVEVSKKVVSEKKLNSSDETKVKETVIDDKQEKKNDKESDEDENEEEFDDEKFNDEEFDDEEFDDEEFDNEDEESEGANNSGSNSSRSYLNSGGSSFKYKTFYNYNADEAKSVEDEIAKAKTSSEGVKKSISSMIGNIKSNLSPETNEKINLDGIEGEMNSLMDKIIDELSDARDNIGRIRKKVRDANDPHSGNSSGGVSSVNSKKGNKTTDNEDPSDEDDFSEYDDEGEYDFDDEEDSIDEADFDFDDVEGDDNVDDDTDSVDEKSVSAIKSTNDNTTTNNSKAVVGKVNIEEGTPLYKELGEKSSQNADSNSNYSLIGVEKDKDKYYYKIIDDKNKNTYYTEINDKVKVDSTLNEILEVKNTTVKIDTMDLNKTSEYAEILNTDEIYFVKSRESYNKDGIVSIAKIIDSNTGKEGYVKIDDKVSIKTLDSLNNTSNK